LVPIRRAYQAAVPYPLLKVLPRTHTDSRKTTSHNSKEFRVIHISESLLDSSSQLDTRGLLTWGCPSGHPHGPTGSSYIFGPNTESTSRRKEDLPMTRKAIQLTIQVRIDTALAPRSRNCNLPGLGYRRPATYIRLGGPPG